MLAADAQWRQGRVRDWLGRPGSNLAAGFGQHRRKAAEVDDVSGVGQLYFPDGAILDAAGLDTMFYGITVAAVVHGLNPGVHTVDVSFSFADGFAGATTFALQSPRNRLGAGSINAPLVKTNAVTFGRRRFVISMTTKSAKEQYSWKHE